MFSANNSDLTQHANLNNQNQMLDITSSINKKLENSIIMGSRRLNSYEALLIQEIIN